MIIAAECNARCCHIDAESINKSNNKSKGMYAVLYSRWRQLGERGMILVSQECRGLTILCMSLEALPIYRQKWHADRKTFITRLWKQSRSAFPSLLILLFITTRLGMWQLSCRRLSLVDYKACHTCTLAARFLKRNPTKGFSLQNSRSKNVKLKPKFHNDI